VHQLNDCAFVSIGEVPLVCALWTFPVRCYHALITSQDIDNRLVQTLPCRLIKRFTSRFYVVNARTQKAYTSYCERSRCWRLFDGEAGFQIGRSLKHALTASRLRIAW